MIDFIGIIGITVSLVGLYVSWLAYREAGSAKTAALKAAQGVKTQSIAFDISEICQKCEINLGYSYEDIRKSYNQVNDGVQRILGYYLEEGAVDQVSKKILDEDVANTLNEIKVQLNALNPGKQDPTASSSPPPDSFYYYQFSDFFGTLSGSLNKFKGVLERKLMQEE
jgi:hypothetical protein